MDVAEAQEITKEAMYLEPSELHRVDANEILRYDLTLPMCSCAWELGVDENGEWVEVLAFGVFTDQVVSYLGGDPARHTAMDRMAA